jgi:hypothetical protein
MMLAFLNQSGFAEMHIAPRQPANQRELIAGHILRFVFADVELFRQTIHQL